MEGAEPLFSAGGNVKSGSRFRKWFHSPLHCEVRGYRRTPRARKTSPCKNAHMDLQSRMDSSEPQSGMTQVALNGWGQGGEKEQDIRTRGHYSAIRRLEIVSPATTGTNPEALALSAT